MKGPLTISSTHMQYAGNWRAYGQQMLETIRFCDKHNVPVATNLASAEMLILGLQRGDLDWREMVRPKNTLL